ncbi:MAG: hypothetical protein A2504_16835 [Bdellovibrionales bacterium RIFOXYD12_FULL_39_22]|nr:MAG: hypothetical protein A2385_14690 [Bdellovibrionales bacterium RIFOXYB1_FULL_39_21]OFZ45037.1 MAG: hypothetical protein A2485_14115 [Bdellovibrionales bacterium RIFOXYC12_FULL_39_17]OFZ49475.1 MAG: hypothetical protein A2404_08600 [Bdellovibrionales bacterium RIFOXYC1_FULL_39_130]OFZ77214.1 MAG: hypothetical protein A2560_08125 [Bdellovibrionales bacterium RIFOXYD1_FULL_39_84]OFZ95659.1 MAG: hypothetical protein A2504_16835 [Bdellovibrionales bacterium RIFOXYD12_FULL_39_22]HLE11173.1 hy
MYRGLILISLSMTLFIFSCGGGGGGSDSSSTYNGYSDVAYASSFVSMLNSNMPLDADDSYVVKNGTEQVNYIVVWDDYQDAYMAYNLYYYVPGMSWSEYVDELDWYGVETFEVERAGTDFYGNQAWKGNNGYGDVYFEDVGEQSKDLEKIGGIEEELKVSKMSEYLTAEFGLSEKRSTDIARLTSEWSQLSKTRSMTDADANSFAVEIFGTGIDTLKNGFQKSIEGDKTDLDKLIEQAAEINEISPEHMNKIVSKILAD